VRKAWGGGKGKRKRFVTWADESGRRHFSKQSEIHNRPAKINTHRVYPIFTTLRVYGGKFLPPRRKSSLSQRSFEVEI